MTRADRSVGNGALMSLMMAVLLGGGSLFGQVDTGIITGTVQDKSGAVVPDAKVTISNTGTGQTQHLTANSNGLYVSLPLYAGEYDVEVEATGFQKTVQRGRLSVAQRLAVDFTLELGALTQVVNVRSAATRLETETSTLSSLQTETAIRNLPLNGPNFAQLMGLAPGVTPAQTQAGIGGSVPITMKRGITAYAVNGLRLEYNAYLVDGILNNENHNGFGILIFPPIDAVEEFRQETSVADARFGRGGGGTVNLIYKSGTRHFHGDVFEFLRNDALDARNFFDQGKPEFRRNQFGGTLGGPLVPGSSPATFFFFDYQGVRERRGQTFINTVPTLEAHNGDFSAYPQKIFNPLTQTSLPGGGFQRQPFGGNIIPSDFFDPVGQKLLNLYPMPNLPGIANNFVFGAVRTVTENDFDIKVSRTFSGADSGWVRYSRSRSDLFEPGSLPAPAVGGGSPTGTSFQPVDQAVVSETHVFSSRMVNQGRFGWTRLNLHSTNLDFGQFLASDIGIPGSNVAGDNLTSGLPLINITGLTPLGENPFNPAIIVSNDYQWGDDLTYLRARHTFKGGFQLIRLQYNAFQSSALRGMMNFSTAYTLNPASPQGTGLGAADLLLGRPISASIQFIVGTRGFRQSDVAGYLQDDIKATDKLTLNLGLRYEDFIGWPWTEVHDRMYQFVPSTQLVLQVGTDGIPPSGVHGRNHDFAPRLGFAYQLRPSTVFRAAFGVFYFAPQWDITRNLSSNPPQAIRTAFTNNQFDFSGARLASDGFDRPALGVILNSALNAIDSNAQTPTTYQWNAAVQQQLPASVVMTVAYVGSKGTFLHAFPDINQPVPGTAPIAQRRPFPLFQTILALENIDNSTYNALQVTGERRFSHGLSFLLSYTYSHNIDFGSIQFPGFMDSYHAKLDRGSADYDIRNRFVASWTYQIPLKAAGLLSHVVQGWQVNGILSLYNGLPFSVGSATNTLNIGSGTRADRTCNGTLPSPTVSRWFDVNCFVPPGAQKFGNGGRNILEGPDTKQLDFSFFKNFALNAHETRALQFRVESFNLFNRPQFNNPSSTLGTPDAGTIRSAGSPITLQRTSREIQVAVKLYW